MSWLFNPEGTPRPIVDEDTKVPDPSNPSVMVSGKSANRPFLAYKEFRELQEQKHRAWLEYKKERDEKLARGEKVGPLERDPTAEVEIGLWGLIKFLSLTLLIIVLAGKFVTGSFLWDYDGKWVQIKTYIPEQQRLFSEDGLAKYDGTDPDMPIFLAIDGEVFDVSKGRHTYGPGGSYNFFAGKDAARAFGTGCFKTHLTHDLRGLTEQEMAGVEHWKGFFANHKVYRKIGRVNHIPIDPESPIPEHCNIQKKEDTDPRKATKEQSTHPKPKAKVDQQREKHQEL